MDDIKQDVKAFVKVFIQLFISSVVKESTKKMIKSLSQRQKKLLEAKSKNMSDDQIIQYLDKNAYFKKTMENLTKSVCDLPSAKGTGSLIGQLESIYENTSYISNPINALILPAPKVIAVVATGTAVVTAVVAIVILVPTANFTSNVTEGPAPLSVQFTDLSENATDWFWDFGDGKTSTEQNTTHTYYVAGDYTVKLKISNDNLTDSKSAKIKVLQPLPLVASFSSNTTQGAVPLSVQFNNSSEKATGWNWDFGDGNNSTDQNPVHTYFAAGNYTVSLTVSNANGTASKSATITVSEKPEGVFPVANFSTNVSEGSAPLSVQFTNSSENATSLSWNFGDGANSSERNPVHTYNTAGNYTVSLTAANENGTNSKLFTINVTKSIPLISWSSPANITYGTGLNSTQLNAKASVPGTFVYTPPPGAVLSAGMHTLHADFTPDDAANYSNTSSNVTINVTKAIPIIAWNNPSGVIYGTTLDSTQLNASSSVPGAFVYTPTAGTRLGAGTHILSVNFTPDDVANYRNISSNVTINVNKATPSIVWSKPADIIYGTALNSIQLDASASVHGTFVYTPPPGTVLSAGTQTLRADFTPDNALNYTTASKGITINILRVTGTFAYITNSGSDSVSVIDTVTKNVVDKVDVGSGPHGVAVNPDGTKVYVTNSNSNNVSVINTATNTVTSTISVGNSPYGVAVSPDGSRVYVTNLNNNNVSVINTATNQVIANVPVGKWPEGVAFTPDGEKAYVANYYSYSTISVIDTAKNTVTTVDDPNISGPSGIAIAPDGKKAYVTSNFNDKVCIIDTTSNQVTATVPVEFGPHGVAVSPDGERVYVANGESGTISVIDTTTNNVVITTVLPAESSPYGIAVSPDGKTVYVSNYRSTNVSIIDTETNQITTVPVGNNPAAFGQFIGTLQH